MNHESKTPAQHSSTIAHTEMESAMELQSELESLRMLVCDLLRSNQQLRIALLAGAAPAPSEPSTALSEPSTALLND